MTDLEKYQLVNQASSFEEWESALSQIFPNGTVQGRTDSFSVKRMTDLSRTYYYDTTDTIIPNVATRMYGLRQQLMYLKHYK